MDKLDEGFNSLQQQEMRPDWLAGPAAIPGLRESFVCLAWRKGGGGREKKRLEIYVTNNS